MLSNDLIQWFDMGGFGIYVWPCYIVALTLILVLSIKSFSAKQVLLKQLEQLQKSSGQSTTDL